MTAELDVRVADGRTVHVYDAAEGDDDERMPVFWHHGTPNIGAPPEPLFAVAERLRMRWVSFDRPGYGGSTPHPGRTLGTVAADVAAVADALGIGRFAVVGHSGGSSHALACAATSGERVLAVVDIAGLAPYGADGLDWFAGMGPAGAASLRTALAGREAKVRRETSGIDSEPDFTPADFAAFDGEWGWLGSVVRPALAAGPTGLIDDDLAYVGPWGCDPGDIEAPVLVVHGQQDRVVPCAHGEWLASRCQRAELRLAPDDGHISVLRHAAEGLAWLSASGRR